MTVCALRAEGARRGESMRIRLALRSRIVAVVGVAAVGLLGVVAPAEAAVSTTPLPPFTQCPAVGASPSCQILLVVDPDGTVSVYSDPSVGDYDGADDTLVGIWNTSGKTVDAVTVTGPGR
jgi:hypothetical protein